MRPLMARGRELIEFRNFGLDGANRRLMCQSARV